MRFLPTSLAGAFIVEVEPLEDERGFFARTWCATEFQNHGLDSALSQCSISFNKARGTVRGLHWQKAPNEEAKLVRCTQGAIFDVAVDVRSDSPTYKHWVGIELTAENRKALFIPAGLAHGFQTLTSNTEVLYQISVAYVPGMAAGVRWNDPALAIDWPITEKIVISARDAGLPLLG